MRWSGVNHRAGWKEQIRQLPDGSGIVPCRHCHERRRDVALRRVPFIGLRPLCTDCVKALNELGYDIRVA
jgi:hypothetical protein